MTASKLNKMCIRDSIYTVDSVDYSTGKVSLRDDTFAGSTGFPIFRSEPIAAVRELSLIHI